MNGVHRRHSYVFCLSFPFFWFRERHNSLRRHVWLRARKQSQERSFPPVPLPCGETLPWMYKACSTVCSPASRLDQPPGAVLRAVDSVSTASCCRDACFPGLGDSGTLATCSFSIHDPKQEEPKERWGPKSPLSKHSTCLLNLKKLSGALRVGLSSLPDRLLDSSGTALKSGFKEDTGAPEKDMCLQYPGFAPPLLWISRWGSKKRHGQQPRNLSKKQAMVWLPTCKVPSEVL